MAAATAEGAFEATLAACHLITLGLRLGPLWAALDATGPTRLVSVSRGD
jgi:hypothetical protein